MMFFVVASALVIWLGIAAVDVYSAKEHHVHMGIDLRGTPSLAAMGGMEPPFWPRYWRRLLGRPWRSQPLCPPTPGVEDEECEFAHPEMVFMFGSQKTYHGNSRQAVRLNEILAEQTRRSGQGTQK
jgi:hypothetical protein